LFTYGATGALTIYFIVK